MSDIVIKAENLGKKYTIGHQATNGRYLALRDVVMQNAHSFWRVTKDLMRGKPIILGDDLEEVWALKNVNFEIRRGEAVGIIGRNGAGKSTLLKVLSRITEPSAGRVTIRGRVASLLEVGTGFHPELTGRENIYLNGAILGMTRAEIRRKFDEIVDFSGVEKFLDTPVKRYSSGMYVRLAFAVAAHLEPEILLVDEVLAVGDAAFQKKCLGKMGSVAKEGRTVLFVSHNMGAITQLCKYAIWLNEGRVRDILPASRAVQCYLQSGSAGVPYISFEPNASRPAQYHSVAIRQLDGEPASEISCDHPFIIELVFQVRQPIPGLYLAFYLRNQEGMRVLFSDIADSIPDPSGLLTKGTHVFKVPIPARLLAPGTYSLTVGSASSGEHIDHRADICSFTIADYETRRQSRPGVIGLRLEWEHSRIEMPITTCQRGA